MKKILKSIIAISIALTLGIIMCSCSSADAKGDGGEGYYGDTIGRTEAYKKGDAAATDGEVGSAYEPDGTSSEISSSEYDSSTESFTPKTLTAAEWNDNKKYDFWNTLFTYNNAQEHLFSENFTLTGDLEKLASSERTVVKVKNGDTAVAGAKVVLKDSAGNPQFSAVTDMSGTAYVFGKTEGATVSVTSGDYSAAQAVENNLCEISLDGANAKSNVLDIMFVVDTTGSMGDELEFLKIEIKDVIQKIAANTESATINLALLFYRDTDDEYVTRKFDFMNIAENENLQTQINNISAQSSNGGGDYPEAVDTALQTAVGMQWSSGTSTKIIFHVLDAPLHDDASKIANFISAVDKAAEKGIRIVPVIASGLDTLGEFTMREAALRTNGTYVFITDDSGYGYSHSVPTVGEFTVEYLNTLLVRLATSFHTGEEIAPIDWRQEN